MFKFKIIERENQSASDPLADLMNKIPVLQEGNLLENQKTATLIITDPREQNIIGGTSLVKRELSHFQEEIRSLLPTGTFCRDFIWECSPIYFVQSQEQSLDPSPSEHFFRYFYHSLYEGLVEFGHQQELGFVIVKLTGEAYPPTKDLGSWPYIIEFFPRECSEDFFYGILPLRGSFYEKYRETWEDLDKTK